MITKAGLTLQEMITKAGLTLQEMITKAGLTLQEMITKAGLNVLEQELLNRPYRLSLPPVFSEGRFAQSSVFCVVFCSLLL
jgi:hypothetical protein